MKKCGFAVSSHVNELGEKEVFCKFYSRWMNCDLGDCSEKCEHYKESIEKDIEYIFQIGLNCFETEKGYHWWINCANKNAESLHWQVCRFGQASSIERAFEEANIELKKLRGDS